MNRKIVGIFVLMLLIATVLPISADLVKNEMNEDLKLNFLAGPWYKTYGGEGNDGFYFALEAHDGGFIAAGFTTSIGEGNYDAWLVKTDVNGDLEWEKTFGGSGDDRFRYMQIVTDGYVLSGQRDGDLYFIKIDVDGNLIWERSFGGSKNEYSMGFRQTSDNGFIITGITESYAPQDTYHMWLIKTDENGIEQWNNTYGRDDYFSEGERVCQTDDGGFIVSGATWALNEWSDIYVVKTDVNGNLEWEKTFFFTYGSVSISIEESKDDSYLISGSTGEPFRGCMAVLINIDSDGDVLFERQYGNRLFLDSFCYAIQTDDEGFIGTGSRLGIGAFFNINLPWFPYWSKICVMKIDSDGNPEWGGSPQGDGQGRSIQKTSDGGFVVSGYTDNFPNFGDGVLFKIDSEGNLP
jgi:hypothetical protein